MPKIARPTIIYWLFDVRPETVAAGWHSGKPFYCGRTGTAPGKRLMTHKSHARRRPDREHSKRILECGEHVAIRVVETVPPDDSWIARERHWIAHLRSHFPGVTNITDGGESPGSGRPSLNIKMVLLGIETETLAEFKSHPAIFGNNLAAYTRKALRNQLNRDKEKGRCVEQFTDVKAAADKAHQAVFDLYQLIGQKDSKD